MTTERPPVEVVVRVRARPTTVFGFFTDPLLYRRWMGDSAELDPRPGGLYRVSMASGQVAEGRFLVVEPPRRVIFTWGWVGDAAVPPGSSTVDISLVADGDDTVVRLVHAGLPGQAGELHEAGWRHFLARLTDVVAGPGPGRSIAGDQGPWIRPDTPGGTE